MSEQQLFAFGKNEYESCYCPAISAGFKVIGDPIMSKVAREFDQHARMYIDDQSMIDGKLPEHGTLDESEAKEVWGQVIDAFDNAVERASGKRDTHQSGLYAQAARQVAHDLGWEEVATS